ncbi:rod shape-determining protein MreD [Legionella oakridgensis]|nr:rod shape-determining protein MreD [Legionella oakridgensis]
MNRVAWLTPSVNRVCQAKWMNMIYFRVRFLLFLLLVLALSIMPLPTWLSEFRPPWALLLILYIQFFLPRFFNVIFIFLVGLCLDVLLSTILGEHVFALLLTAWLASGKARRFNFFPIGQQMMLILLFCSIYQCIILMIDAVSGYQFMPFKVICSSMVATLAWPWIRILADNTLLTKVTKMTYR